MRRPDLHDVDVGEVRRHLGRAVDCYPATYGSDLDVIVGLTEAAKVLDTMLAEAVSSARADGITWAVLGEVMGTTRQAVHKRFGHDTTAGDPQDVAVTASRRHEVADLNALGARGYQLTQVGLRRLGMQLVGSPTEHARAVGISEEARRLVEDGWTVVGWRFPDVFFRRDARAPDGAGGSGPER